MEHAWSTRVCLVSREPPISTRLAVKRLISSNLGPVPVKRNQVLQSGNGSNRFLSTFLFFFFLFTRRCRFLEMPASVQRVSLYNEKSR